MSGIAYIYATIIMILIKLSYFFEKL